MEVHVLNLDTTGGLEVDAEILPLARVGLDDHVGVGVGVGVGVRVCVAVAVGIGIRVGLLTGVFQSRTLIPGRTAGDGEGKKGEKKRTHGGTPC
ncbi:TPA: hypothetical protein DEP34_00055 [Candidatus Uhrbacteria bacterium]|nr:hypothetical protein [Candidatus Uhrbacteria bacterium]